MYDDYPPSYRNDLSGPGANNPPIFEEGGAATEPPSYGNLYPPFHHSNQQQPHSHHHPHAPPLNHQQSRDGVEPLLRSTSVEKTPSQYFFPDSSSGGAGRLPMSAPINRRQMRAGRDRESSSSCSSFSLSDGVKTTSSLPRKSHRRDQFPIQVVDLDEKPIMTNITPSNAPNSTENNITSNNNNNKVDERGSPVNVPATDTTTAVTAMKPYDDCKLSVAKDVVMIYQGTPKLPVKASIATKDGKQKLLKLTSKIKRQKKSLDSLSSRDSLNEKATDSVVLTAPSTNNPESSSKKKSKDKDSASSNNKESTNNQTGSAVSTPKETFRTKTRNLKHRLLNKSHSSDLALEKSAINKTRNKRAAHLFDIYSMSNFPDRVASDQCLSMTDRYLSEMNSQHRHHLPADMHHGSWSSCDVTREEPASAAFAGAGGDGYPPNFFPPSPQMTPVRDHHLANGGGSVHSHSYLNEGVCGGGGGSLYNNKQNYNNHYHHQTNATSLDGMAKLSINNGHHSNNDSAVESDRSKSTSKPKKSSLLKNPLKKKNKKKSTEDH